MKTLIGLFLRIGCFLAVLTTAALAEEPGLVGYWKLQGDCKDFSGHGHHGIEHGVGVGQGVFDGKKSSIEVPAARDFDFGSKDFSIAAWVNVERGVSGVVGDLVTKFDHAGRIGFNLTINAANPGYNSQSDVRNLFFGIDNGTEGQWADCGRPGGKAHSSDALTVFEGHLYAGTTDGPTESDWAHVYRYLGGEAWEDCGRVGNGRTRGVYALVVHSGSLYAATSASHGRQPSEMSFGRVYRYRGGNDWEDIGQPGANFRLNSLASYRGKLYVAGFNIGPALGHCYVYEGDAKWQECGEFAGWPHTLLVHDGRLLAAYPKGEVYAYDGSAWENLGNPLGSTRECTQIHSMSVYRGELYAGCWPSGKAAVLHDGKWLPLGRLGDATEIVGLTVFNGSQFAGTIPRAELFRFDAPEKWTSIRRLFDPPGYEPVPIGGSGPGIADWSRASSLAVFQGKLFVSTATCYRTNITSPLPDEVRGKVFSYSTGAAISSDRDLDAGWRHIAAIREGRTMRLYIDGKQAASSNSDTSAMHVSNAAPLLIGFGAQSYFRGRMREVRLYDRAIEQRDMEALLERRPQD